MGGPLKTRIFWLLTILFLVSPSFAQEPLTARLIALGTPNHDNDELIDQIKKDLKIDIPVSLLIGPYVSPGNLLKDLPGGHYIIVDKDFYESLSPEERKALIAHELGHIQYTARVNVYNDLDASMIQSISDVFAIKYVGINAVISFLNKICTGDDKEIVDCKFRIGVLQYLKQTFAL